MSDRYDPTTPEGIAARLTDLRVKLEKRRGYKEFIENVPAIEAEIARLEALARS